MLLVKRIEGKGWLVAFKSVSLHSANVVVEINFLETIHSMWYNFWKTERRSKYEDYL